MPALHTIHRTHAKITKALAVLFKNYIDETKNASKILQQRHQTVR